MAQQTVLVSSKAHLSISNGLLSVRVDGKAPRTIPLEDIWVVIVESHYTTLTAACLSQLSDAGIGVMLCGRDHMPNGLLLPLGAHSRHAAIVDDQLAMGKPLQKQLWRRIVQAKIRNQAAVLEELGLPADEVRACAKAVRSGDVDNREAVAAALYFKVLLPDGGRRGSAQTAALDYGYGVLRAGIGRAAVGGGWLVSRGIHHSNNYNAFNLVDDLIEPFRPLVDAMVLHAGIVEPLAPQDKRQLVRVFEHVMRIDGKLCSCEQCINVMFASLRTAVLEADPERLLLPEFCGVQTIAFE